MNIHEAYNRAIFLLQNDQIKNPALEARLLISYILKIDQKKFILELDKKKITLFQWALIKNKIRRRLKGISIAYLIHRKFFYDSELFVNRSVLIPRPETELLIDIIMQNINESNFYNILDIGTGSGNISIELARKIKDCRIDSLDKSRRSLKVAAKNIRKNKIPANKINLMKKNIFDFRSHKKYDIIVSNPPYIATKEVNYLIKNKIVSDPVTALDGGKDGLKFYFRLKSLALENMNENGFMLLEHGFDQKENILTIFDKSIFVCETHKDLNDLDRAILVRFKG
jgi:release factor glutamine methyltransferase